MSLSVKMLSHQLFFSSLSKNVNVILNEVFAAFTQTLNFFQMFHIKKWILIKYIKSTLNYFHEN